MIEGSILDWRIRVQLEKEPKDGDEALCGYWTKNTNKQQGLIGLDQDMGAIAMMNTLMVHEPLHAVVDITGIKLKHKDIYLIASALVQFWVTTGILDPLAIEAKIRRLAADSKDLELTEGQQ